MLITRFMISSVVTTLVIASTLVALTFPTVDYSASQILTQVLLVLLMLAIGAIQGLLIACRYPLHAKRHAVGVVCYATAIMVSVGILVLDLGIDYSIDAVYMGVISAWTLVIVGNYLNKD